MSNPPPVTCLLVGDGCGPFNTSIGNQTPPHMQSDSVWRCLQGLTALGRTLSRSAFDPEIAMDNGIHVEEDCRSQPNVKYLQAVCLISILAVADLDLILCKPGW